MPIERVTSLDDPRLAWYRGVSDPSLLREGGRFVAEGRAVVARLLGRPEWPVESVLVSPAALAALEPALGPRLDEVPVFVVALDELVALAGFNVHRGCLAIGRRRPPVPLDALVGAGTSAWFLGLERLADPDNVGACFRNAAAFGVDAVLLDDACADPLYRKGIRTSMGATLQVPFVRLGAWVEAIPRLQRTGVQVVAMTPEADAEELDTLDPALAGATGLLVLVGSEGPGLRPETLALCDRRARIGMAPGVDSINVATAAAVALHWFTGRRSGPRTPGRRASLPGME